MKWIWLSNKLQPTRQKPKKLPEPETQRSLALKTLTQRLRREKQYNVLDLGCSVRQ